MEAGDWLWPNPEGNRQKEAMGDLKTKKTLNK